MKERPIIFNTEMVKAILDGKKTQTRRPIKSYTFMGEECIDVIGYNGKKLSPVECKTMQEQKSVANDMCPYGKIGDVLWVRETIHIDHEHGVKIYKADLPQHINDEISGEKFNLNEKDFKWTPSIHMTRDDSRITLEITDIIVERVQDISEEEARLEGIIDRGCLNCGCSDPCGCENPTQDARDAFVYLWNSIYEKTEYSWCLNPFVWVIKFKKVEA